MSKSVMKQRGKGYVFKPGTLWRGDFAERDEVGFDGNPFGDFHVKKGLKGLEIAGIGYGETQQQFLYGFFAAGIFDGALGTESGGAGDDHNGARGVESGD